MLSTFKPEKFDQGKLTAKWGRKVMDLLPQTARLPNPGRSDFFVSLSKEVHIDERDFSPAQFKTII